MVDSHLHGYNDELKAKGYDVRVVGVKSNITQEDEVEALVRRVVKDEGRLDWFVSTLQASNRD